MYTMPSAPLWYMYTLMYKPSRANIQSTKPKEENRMNNTKEIKESTRKELERIAMSASIELKERGGIEDRNNDREDFPEISIWAIRKMLEKAYLLGKEEA